MTLETLEKDLQAENLHSIYLLYGEETFLLETIVKRITKSFGETMLGINYIKLYETDVNSLIQNIETPSFGYEKKLIIVKNSNLFKKETTKKGDNKALAEKINTYMQENMDIINSSTVIIFIETAIEKNNLFKTIDKLGITCEFTEQKPMQIISRLKAICSSYKVNIKDADLNYLITVCGTNMQDLINELRKLIEYAGTNGTIEKKDIDALCIKQIDVVIFDLTDALGSKKIKEGLNIIKDLVYAKEPIQRILITLYNHFKKLYITKLCIKNNMDIATNLELKPNQMFLVSKYKTQSGYFEESVLKKILQELVDLDYKYKVGLIDINLGLESIICRYC